MRDMTGFPGRIAQWPAPPWVQTWSSERGLDMGGQGEHLDELARTNRNILARHLGVDVLWLDQVHGGAVSVEGRLCEADALVTRRHHVACAVRTGDCLRILLCHEQMPVVAAVHAGWKGVVAGIIEKTVRQMGGDPAHILAWMGPAIGPDAFEVGPEMRALCLHDHPEAGQAFRPGTGDRWWADLYVLARLRLAHAGVTHCYGGGACTVNDPARFYSWRREGERAGRMAHLIWMEGEPDELRGIMAR